MREKSSKVCTNDDASGSSVQELFFWDFHHGSLAVVSSSRRERFYRLTRIKRKCTIAKKFGERSEIKRQQKANEILGSSAFF